MSTFKKALAKEKNPEARRHLDAFYKSLVKEGRIKDYIKTDWEEDNPVSQILQFVGCDVAFSYGAGRYKFVDEKVCGNYNEMLYFELDNAGKKHTGWAVSEYKKTDILVYYMSGVGLFVLPAQQLKEWLLDQEGTLEKHFSDEGKRRNPNRNARVHKDIILEQFPNCFVSCSDLELLSNIILRA